MRAPASFRGKPTKRHCGACPQLSAFARTCCHAVWSCGGGHEEPLIANAPFAGRSPEPKGCCSLARKSGIDRHKSGGGGFEYDSKLLLSIFGAFSVA